MRDFDGIRGVVRVLAVVAAWRGLSELIARQRLLASSGDLAVRVERRRGERVQRALASAGLRAPAREPARVLVPAAPVRRDAWATVQVGTVEAADLDDVGLLEAAMRRSARQRQLVTRVDERAHVHRTDWGGLVEEVRPVERARDAIGALGVLPFLAMLSGVTLTFIPLVRPLAGAAPWLALGGLALVAAGVLGGRWTRGRDADDLDDDAPESRP